MVQQILAIHLLKEGLTNIVWCEHFLQVAATVPLFQRRIIFVCSVRIRLVDQVIAMLSRLILCLNPWHCHKFATILKSTKTHIPTNIPHDQTLGAQDEIKNRNQNDFADALKSNNGFWTCVERVTALTYAGSPSDKVAISWCWSKGSQPLETELLFGMKCMRMANYSEERN